MKRLGKLVLFLIFLPAMAAESFTVRNVYTSDMNKPGQATVVMQISDGLRIVLPEDRTHLRFIELEIRLPVVLAARGDAFGYRFYDNIASEPGEGGGYAGEPVYASSFPPSRVAIHLAIPYAPHTIQSTPYMRVLPVVAGDGTSSLFLHLVQMDKSLSREASPGVMDALVYVTVRPQLEDKGALDLTINYTRTENMRGQERPYTVFIDEAPQAEDRIVLPTGTHHLSVVSDYFRNEVRTFIIEKGAVTSLVIVLRDIAPTLTVNAPDDVDIFLDDKKISGKGTILVAQGDHNLRFNIGGYEIFRALHIENGRSYQISLFFDVEIEEIR